MKPFKNIYRYIIIRLTFIDQLLFVKNYIDPLRQIYDGFNYM